MKQNTINMEVAKSSNLNASYTPAPSATPDLFLDLLPGELRNRIYELALPQNKMIKVLEGGSCPLDSGLLRVCKQIRSETAGIYYPSNFFTVLAELKSLDKVIAWMESIVKLVGVRPFGKIRLALRSVRRPSDPKLEPFTFDGALKRIFLNELVLLWPLAYFLSSGAIDLEQQTSGPFPSHPPDNWGLYSKPSGGHPLLAMSPWARLGWNLDAIEELREFAKEVQGVTFTGSTSEDYEEGKVKHIGSLCDVFYAWMEWKKKYPLTKARLNGPRNGFIWKSKKDQP